MTIASKTATTIAIGTSLLSPSARLDPPTATTNRISSVAYAVDDNASDENTARAMVFGSRCSSIWVVASGRPTTSRFKTSSTRPPVRSLDSFASMAPIARTRTERASDLTRTLRQSFAREGVGEGEGSAELVRQRDGGHALLDRHRDVGVPNQDEPGRLVAPFEHRELDAVGRERDAAREPSLLRRVDVAPAFEPWHRVQEGRELEEAVVQREEVAQLARHRLGDLVERCVARHQVGDAVHVLDGIGGLVALALGAAAT